MSRILARESGANGQVDCSETSDCFFTDTLPSIFKGGATLGTSVGEFNVFQISKSSNFLRQADRLWPYVLIVSSVVGFLYRAVR